MIKKQTTEKTAPPLEVTPIDQWKSRNEQTELLELPDGFVVKVKRLDLVGLAVTGYVPLALVGTLMATGAKLQDPDQLGTVKQDDLAKLNDMLRSVALKAVVEPQLTETDEENALHVDTLGVLNLLAIFTAAVDTSGAGAFRPFRGK